MLAEHGEDARIIAGGQSLLAMLNMRLAKPSVLVDINGVPGLAELEHSGAHLRIGALVRYAQALQHPLLPMCAPLLARALPHVAHAAIRNRGTLGGSVAFADPAAEMPACLLALGGAVEIAGLDGPRTVAADDFFHDLYETALAQGEMLTALRIPAHTPERRVGFAEFARRAGDYALVGLAATARALDGRLTELRLVYFSVGATPVRARAAEAALEGAPLDALPLDAAVAALESDLDPPTDIQASRDTRLHLAGVLLRQVAGQLTEPVS